MLRAIDHVQIAIPVGGEDAARPFYRDLLGLTEVPKTGVQATRGGCWFESGAIKVHLGVEEAFRANKKAHVAFVVDDVGGLGARAKAAGYETKSDDDLAGYERIFIYDPFGNRLEFLKPLLPSPWRGEGPGMGVGDSQPQKHGSSELGRSAQRSGTGAIPIPDPSPLQGEGKRRETVVAGGVERARRLRQEMTLAERVLWKQLRKLGMNFRRQAPVGRYIVDFMHHESGLIVEVDGPVHDEPEVAARDLERTAWLQARGYRVIRFPEKDVRERLHEVTERIAAEAVPPPSPTLPPSRGKGEARYQVR